MEQQADKHTFHKATSVYTTATFICPGGCFQTFTFILTFTMAASREGHWLPNCQNNHRSRQRRRYVPVNSKTAHSPPSIWLALSSVQWGIWPKMRPARWGIWLSCQMLHSPKKHRCCNKINFVTATFLWRDSTARQFHLKQYSNLKFSKWIQILFEAIWISNWNSFSCHLLF